MSDRSGLRRSGRGQNQQDRADTARASDTRTAANATREHVAGGPMRVARNFDRLNAIPAIQATAAEMRRATAIELRTQTSPPSTNGNLRGVDGIGSNDQLRPACEALPPTLRAPLIRRPGHRNQAQPRRRLLSRSRVSDAGATRARPTSSAGIAFVHGDKEVIREARTQRPVPVRLRTTVPRLLP